MSRADTFLLSCIDPRLTDDTTFRFAALGRTDRYSEMRIAGGALALVSEASTAQRDAVWENLAATRALHGIRHVTLLNHRDCGAVTQWAARPLAQDRAEEARLHAEILNNAADAIRARHPDLTIELKLMELDGTVTRPACRSCIPAGFRQVGQGRDGIPLLAPLHARAGAPAGPPAGPPVGPASGAGNPGAESGLPVAEPPAPAAADRFADLARLRHRAGGLDAAGETALLEAGIRDMGLSLAQARGIAAAAAPASGRQADADIAAYLRLHADARGRLRRNTLDEATALLRALRQPAPGPADARAEVGRIAAAQGFTERRGWFG